MFSLFVDELGEEVTNEKIVRTAIRAVIVQNKRLLLLQTKKGDLKFPGGGLKEEETHEQCLKREVKEETGYMNIIMGDLIGTHEWKGLDGYKQHTTFIAKSYYYICQLADAAKVDQQLDYYEKELDFTVKWCHLDEAINQNMNALMQGDANDWVTRELIVLLQLKQSI